MIVTSFPPLIPYIRPGFLIPCSSPLLLLPRNPNASSLNLPFFLDNNNEDGVERIRWCPPPLGLIKFNTDASLQSSGKIGFGVVARDEVGRWVTGCCGYRFGDVFDKECGPKSQAIVQGELGAILVALTVAMSRGFRKIIIESDCKNAIDMISSDKFLEKYPELQDKTADMVLECRQLADMLCTCIFVHQKREGNFCADKLADMGAKGNKAMQDFGIHIPSQVVPFLIADRKGFCFPRGIRLTQHKMIDIITSNR